MKILVLLLLLLYYIMRRSAGPFGRYCRVGKRNHGHLPLIILFCTPLVS